MELAWQSEGACCVAAQNEVAVLFQGHRYFIPLLTMTSAKLEVQIILYSVDIPICLALLVLFSIITVKSHCCDRQYSRKQRIFLYLLLASLGDSIVHLVVVCAYRIELVVRNGVNWGFTVLFNVTFCWAVLHMCFEVFTTLRRTEFHCLRFKFHTVVEEVCILIVIITISTGCAAATFFTDNNWVVVVSIVLLWFPTTASIVFVLVQLCLACRRVEGGQVANRLKVTVTLLLLFMLCYVAGICVVITEGHRWDLYRSTIYLLIFKGVPYMFVIFFGRKMLQDLGRQCCCRRYRRRRGYGQIPGQEERGVLSVQTGVPSTTRTYYTCDDVASATYYTCDESQPPEWFQAVPAPDPPVQ